MFKNRIVAAINAGLSGFGGAAVGSSADTLPVDKWPKSQNRISQKKRRARARWKK